MKAKLFFDVDLISGLGAVGWGVTALLAIRRRIEASHG